MSVVEIVDHPLIQHKISLLRDRNTGTKEFRDLVSEIAMLLCYEATRDLPTEEVEVETPVALARTKVLAGRKLALVPILRAGLGMVDGMLNLIPAAKVGHIGMSAPQPASSAAPVQTDRQYSASSAMPRRKCRKGGKTARRRVPLPPGTTKIPPPSASVAGSVTITVF